MFMQVSIVISIHQLHTLLDYLHFHQCFQCIYTLNSLFHKHLQLVLGIPSSHFITFHHISSHYPLSLKSYSGIRNVHHISSHFITFINFSLNIYSQFRNPSSTIIQHTATLPLLFYTNVHILTYSLFTNIYTLLQESIINLSLFITFYHFLTWFYVFLIQSTYIQCFTTFNKEVVDFTGPFQKHIEFHHFSHTFHTLFTYFL